MTTEEIYNSRKVSDQITTGGQPTEAQLRSAAADGVQAVINLVPFQPGRSLPDEPGLVQTLGMAYFAIPVDWEHPTVSDFSAFERVMQGLGEKKTLIHCAANFRVTAFYSLYALKHLAWSEAEADALRASVWKGSDYPVWEAFIAELKMGMLKGE